MFGGSFNVNASACVCVRVCVGGFVFHLLTISTIGFKIEIGGGGQYRNSVSPAEFLSPRYLRKGRKNGWSGSCGNV